MRRRLLGAAGAALAVILLATLLVAWLLRFRVADATVERKLARAGVPASYRITKIGPFLERMEQVRLGDPAAPDLTARRIDVKIGYSLAGPAVRSIAVDGLRLHGRYDGQQLHFGALDRLLPPSRGKQGLPDMLLSIRDTRLALATPAGMVSTVIEGGGNPAHDFHGSATLVALSLRSGGCVARNMAAMLKVSSKHGSPEARGPIRISGLTCLPQKVVLGQGTAQIDLSSDAKFERVKLRANLAGAAGRIQKIGFASFAGELTGSRAPAGLAAALKIGLKSVAAPAFSHALAGSGPIAVGTPMDPVARRAISSAVALLERADATAVLSLEHDAGRPLAVRLHHLAIRGAGGAQLVANEGAGLSWTPAGMRIDGDIELAGGGLPSGTIQLRQPAAGMPLTGIATMQPYRADAAQLVVAPIRFGWDGERMGVETVLKIDGPMGDGFVRGLTLPVRGDVAMNGTVRFGQGCQTLGFREMRFASFLFDPAQIAICGRPVIARNPAGALQIDATTGSIRLSGHAAGGASVALGASGARVTSAGFTVRDLAATLGSGLPSTHLAVAMLGGTISQTLGGRFAGAAGAIGNVPLAITAADGSWTVAARALRLSGQLVVSDTDQAARFNPLASDDARLGLRGGRIEASATLRAPASGAEVAKVSLEHDLSRGTGWAELEVPAIVFQPGKLQPEALTPLTLGVIANVAGSITGKGRIHWSPQGVTSSGDFATDRIDLAAAFGPVTGIKGRLHFKDLLGLVTDPHQEATIAEVNPGVPVSNGVAHIQLIGGNRVRVEEAYWPFALGELRLEPTTLDFGAQVERHMSFRITGLDAAAFVQQLDFPNIAATGTFDGVLPMIFDQAGGRIEAGLIEARPIGGTLAYVGELSNAQLGTMGKLAFDALKAIRYSSLDISLDGRLDGEMVSRVRFTGVREATPSQSLITRLMRNLPFRFNITVRAPFRGLVGSARAYIDPSLLLTQVPRPATPEPAHPLIQPPASAGVP